jgi:hypothetical protein
MTSSLKAEVFKGNIEIMKVVVADQAAGLIAACDCPNPKLLPGVQLRSHTRFRPRKRGRYWPTVLYNPPRPPG